MTLTHSRPYPPRITGVGYQLTTYVLETGRLQYLSDILTIGLINHYKKRYRLTRRLHLQSGISTFMGNPLSRLIFSLFSGHHRRSSSSSGSWGLRLDCPSPRTSFEAGIHLRWCPHPLHSQVSERRWSPTTLAHDAFDVSFFDDVAMLRYHSGALFRGRITPGASPLTLIPRTKIRLQQNLFEGSD